MALTLVPSRVRELLFVRKVVQSNLLECSQTPPAAAADRIDVLQLLRVSRCGPWRLIGWGTWIECGGDLGLAFEVRECHCSWLLHSSRFFIVLIHVSHGFGQAKTRRHQIDFSRSRSKAIISIGLDEVLPPSIASCSHSYLFILQICSILSHSLWYFAIHAHCIRDGLIKSPVSTQFADASTSAYTMAIPSGGDWSTNPYDLHLSSWLYVIYTIIALSYLSIGS